MAEATSWVRLGQEVVSLPGAVSGVLVNLILALFPSLVHFHAVPQLLPIGGYVCHRSTSVSSHSSSGQWTARQADRQTNIDVQTKQHCLTLAADVVCCCMVLSESKPFVMQAMHGETAVIIQPAGSIRQLLSGYLLEKTLSARFEMLKDC